MRHLRAERDENALARWTGALIEQDGANLGIVHIDLTRLLDPDRKPRLTAGRASIVSIQRLTW